MLLPLVDITLTLANGTSASLLPIRNNFSKKVPLGRAFHANCT